MKQLVIKLDDENKPEVTLREVLRLLEEGYTSGYYPNWEIKEVRK